MVPLKVYYCRSCMHRMPLYYRKGEPFRNDELHYCTECYSHDLVYQIEKWIKVREELWGKLWLRADKENFRLSAPLWNR